MSEQAEVKPCDVCGEDAVLDGEQGIEHGGQVLCEDCPGKPVTFEATCECRGWGDCDWSVEVEGTEFNRFEVRQNAQMKANNHETRKRVFEQSIHETTVTEVEPTHDGY